MPRVTELPLPKYPFGRLDGNESFPVVQDGTTVQGKIYNVRYDLLSQGTSAIYDFELLSYELNGYVSIANLKFYQSGVEIPAANVVSIEFVGTAPLQITNGSLNDILDGDNSTYVRFQFDTNTWDTLIRVTFNSANYRIDEIRVSAPTAASGINLEELPAYAVIRAAGSGSNPQYTFDTYANPANDWENPWTYELERIATSPLLLSNPYTPSYQFTSVGTPFDDAAYGKSDNPSSIIFYIPNVDVSVQDSTSQVIVAGDNGLPVQKGTSIAEVEILSHRDNTAVIFTASGSQLNQTFYFFNDKYTANTIIVKNNTNADHIITVFPSSTFTNAKLSPIRAKKTIINTSPTYNVTLDVSQFATVIGATNAVIPPLTVAHFVEYESGAIAIWQ